MFEVLTYWTEHQNYGCNFCCKFVVSCVKYIYIIAMLNVWKIFNQTKAAITKHMQKGKQFFSSIEAIKIQDILYKIQKFHKNVIGFNNHTQRFSGPNYLGVDIPL